MERIAEKVCRAISDENLSNKEAGKILGVSPNYLSMIKKDTYFDKVPKKAWDNLHAWVNSGAAKIKGYNVLIDHDIMVPNLEDKPEEEPGKDIYSDLAKAKYADPERLVKPKKPLPPIVQEAMSRKIQKDLANVPLVQDVILNLKVKLSIEF